jgi:hypothetical protein
VYVVCVDGISMAIYNRMLLLKRRVDDQKVIKIALAIANEQRGMLLDSGGR